MTYLTNAISFVYGAVEWALTQLWFWVCLICLLLIAGMFLGLLWERWRNRPNTYKFKSEISNKTFRNYQGSTNGYVK